MTDYAALQRTYTRAKGALTRAKNSGDPWQIIATVKAVRGWFDRDGWPDKWPTWAIAVRDLEFDEDREVRAAARAEADAWG